MTVSVNQLIQRAGFNKVWDEEEEITGWINLCKGKDLFWWWDWKRRIWCLCGRTVIRTETAFKLFIQQNKRQPPTDEHIKNVAHLSSLFLYFTFSLCFFAKQKRQLHMLRHRGPGVCKFSAFSFLSLLLAHLYCVWLMTEMSLSSIWKHGNLWHNSQHALISCSLVFKCPLLLYRHCGSWMVTAHLSPNINRLMNPAQGGYMDRSYRSRIGGCISWGEHENRLKRFPSN